VGRTDFRSWIATQFDDYVEETAVGHRWWLIVLLFAIAMAIAAALLEVIFPTWYHPGDVVISFLIGALVGLALVLIARERGKARAAAIDDTSSVAALRRKPWGEFEILVGEAIRRKGYLVKERGGFHRDRGMDLIAERGNERVIVQCKHWLKWKVHEDAVKVLYADVQTQGFTEGWMVTCGRFTDYAVQWAAGKPIRLVDGQGLVQLIASRSAVQPPPAPGVSESTRTPTCPNCGSSLDHLTNRYDRSRFWGCKSPTCGWTFDDPPANPPAVRCSRGHTMLRAETNSGASYWRCLNCSRKRLWA
jgi:restriction system protein